ncbi:hypothetical protein WAI78_22185, partial [Acinetobacter baumannii]
VRKEGRNDLFAADAHKLALDFFRIIDPLDAHLIRDAEDDRAAASIGERNDLLRYSFRIGEFDFEFEKGIFTAAH